MIKLVILSIALLLNNLALSSSVSELNIREIKLRVDEYGQGSKTIILIHGGPSLFGYMKSLGDLLKDDYMIVDYAQRGTFESPLDGDISIDDHINDLSNLISKYTTTTKPIIIGHSWGADLALLTVAKHKNIVEKVILLGTAALTDEISNLHGDNLNSRYTNEVKLKLKEIDKKLDESQSDDETNKIMQERLALTSPFYHLDAKTEDKVPASDWNFQSFLKSIDSIWDLIDTGTVPSKLQSIEDQVVAFHGDYDPIPVNETFDYLKSNLKNLQTIEVKKSGHFPWLEDTSKDKFLEILLEELKK